MPRAVWTGSISFGLVNIGVRLFPATSPKDVRFHLVDEGGRRVRYRRFIEDDVRLDSETDEGPNEAPDDVVAAPVGGDREIEYGELMRGYETDEGIVVLDRDEIESARPTRSRTIDIEDFVDLADVDPVYFEKSYIVSPQPDAARPYAVLLRAMEDAGRVGIGRFVLRTKPHLVAIRPADGVLGLETLFFGDEVREGRSLAGAEDVDASPQELHLAEMLIDTLKVDWDPARYADTYREELLRRIAEKAPQAGHRPERVAAGPRIEELMDALKASVEAAKEAKKAPSKKRTA